MWLITFGMSSWKTVCWIRWRNWLFEIESWEERQENISFKNLVSTKVTVALVWAHYKATFFHIMSSRGFYMEHSLQKLQMSLHKLSGTLICREVAHKENTSLLEQLISPLASRSYIKRSFIFEWVWDWLIWNWNRFWQRELHLTLKRHLIDGEIHQLERIRRWWWWWWW